MPTIQEINAQIKALPSKYIFYTRKEIRYLPKILTEGERILALTSGFLGSRTWLLVCTSYRVLFLNRGFFWGLQQVQMNLDRVQAVESSFGLLFGSIRMWDGASSMNINMIVRQSVPPFVRTVQTAMDQYKRQMVHSIVDVARGGPTPGAGNAPQPHPVPHTAPQQPHPAPQAPAAAHTAWMAELEQLAKMKADGHLSDAEFTAAKAKLLGHS